MNVQDLMSANLRTCGPDDSLESIGKTMWDSNVGAIPIVDVDHAPVGIVTDRDIAMCSALSHRPLWELTARDVIGEQQVHACRIEEDVKAALKIMWAQHVRRLPVVDENGRVQGILSIDDIILRAERGSRGQRPPELSYDDAITALKAVAHQSY